MVAEEQSLENHQLETFIYTFKNILLQVIDSSKVSFHVSFS